MKLTLALSSALNPLATSIVRADERLRPEPNRFAPPAPAGQSAADLGCVVAAKAPDIYLSALRHTNYGDTEDICRLKKSNDILSVHPRLVEKLHKTCPYPSQPGTITPTGAQRRRRDYPGRTKSQQLFLDFFALPTGFAIAASRGSLPHAETFGPSESAPLILLSALFFAARQTGPQSPLHEGPYETQRRTPPPPWLATPMRLLLSPAKVRPACGKISSPIIQARRSGSLPVEKWLTCR